MTPEEATALLKHILSRLAPEADLANLDPKAPIRDTVDLDSMDFLNVIIAIDETGGIDIPESDYDQLTTLERAATYLAGRSADG